MTQEMPRTKPNIIITARLLLIPVLRSVELNPVPCAKADRVLSVRMAAIIRSDGSREWTLVAIFFVSFISLMIVYFLSVSGFSAEHATTISQARGAKMYVIHKMQLSPCYG